MPAIRQHLIFWRLKMYRAKHGRITLYVCLLSLLLFWKRIALKTNDPAAIGGDDGVCPCGGRRS